MDFFGKLKETITTTSKDVAEKAKDAAGIASLKSQINAQETIIKKSYIELGKNYFEAHGSDPDDACAAACQAIAKAMAEIEDLKEKIAVIKGPDAAAEAEAEEAAEPAAEAEETTEE